MSQRIIKKIVVLFDGVPVTSTKSDKFDVEHLDNIAIVVQMTGSSTTATVTPEASIDGTTWVSLDDNTLTVGPSDLIALFNLNEIPFMFARISFDLIVSGGDTFTAKGVAKGFT